MILCTVPGDSHDSVLYKPFACGDYKFLPMDEHNSEARSGRPRLLEMVVMSTSCDAPHKTLRSEDGNLHTGDLFEEIRPGLYKSHGRNDDWIKLFNAARCNTRYGLFDVTLGNHADVPAGWK